ncbi:MAG TPA: hypothetical protein VGB37_17105 [Candidatus Lokiarchaeia archaeon]
MITKKIITFKVFNSDWTCRDFKYKIGKLYKTKDELSLCNNGFHSCFYLKNCFQYYAFLQYKKVAIVEISGKIIGDKNDKYCSEKIKIIKELSWEEVLEKLKNENMNIEGMNRSNGINESYGINGSDGINRSGGINRSDGINGSYGINRSYGINISYGILNCSGLSYNIFNCNKEIEFRIFNKIVSENRYNEVWAEIQKFNFYPKFNNYQSLLEKYKNNYSIPFDEDVFKENTKKDAWSDMPFEMIEYIKELPEFDSNIFFEITGIK